MLEDSVLADPASEEMISAAEQQLDVTFSMSQRRSLLYAYKPGRRRRCVSVAEQAESFALGESPTVNGRCFPRTVSTTSRLFSH